MKLTSLAVVFAIACGGWQSLLAQEKLYSFGFTNSRGVELLKGLVEVCHHVSAKVKTVDSNGSVALDKSQSSEIIQAVESAIEPILKRYNVPISKCTQADYKSTTMASFALGVTVTPSTADRELLEVRVSSELSEVVKSIRSDGLARVNLLVANNVKLIRNKERNVFAITSTSMRQANWTAETVNEQKTK